MASIARRIYRSTFTLTAVSIVSMIIAIVIINEDLEKTMQNLDFAAQRDFIFKTQNPEQTMHWQTATMTAIYVPAGHIGEEPLPAMFQGLPANYSGELENGNETYLINVSSSPAGTLYFARDISLFEQREHLFSIVLLVIGGVIIAINFVLAIITSRKLSRPLRKLSQQIANTPIGKKIPRLALDFEDQELQIIAETFNDFLEELESFVQREHNLISLASHELRTPISVIVGAADILEQRGNLDEKNQRTLQRIARTATEMQANIDMLLKLSRRESGELQSHTFALSTLLEEVMEDLNEKYAVYERITLGTIGRETIFADRTLAKMLIRNLVHNALQHTRGAIQIDVQDGIFSIADQGSGLSSEQRQRLTSSGEPVTSVLNGLGLYVVSLLCERLEWSLEVVDGASGTLIKVRYQPSTGVDREPDQGA